MTHAVDAFAANLKWNFGAEIFLIKLQNANENQVDSTDLNSPRHENIHKESARKLRAP